MEEVNTAATERESEYIDHHFFHLTIMTPPSTSLRLNMQPLRGLSAICTVCAYTGNNPDASATVMEGQAGRLAPKPQCL